MGVAAVRTVGLTKDYGAGRGLFDLEVQVSAGESFGLLGPQGSGKSTALRLLMGMLRPTRGSAYAFGLECVREAVEVKRRTGYVPGETPDFGSMRGGEVAAYMAGLRGGVHEDRIRELAERFDLGLRPRHDEYGRGDRQKLSIILGFMHEPALLILDDPTVDLDANGEGELRALIDEARARNATVVFASRDRAEVERHCDTVGFLRRGRLERTATVEELGLELGEPSRKALPP